MFPEAKIIKIKRNVLDVHNNMKSILLKELSGGTVLANVNTSSKNHKNKQSSSIFLG